MALIFEPFRTSNFIWMNNSSLESSYVFVFRYHGLNHLSCDIFADVSGSSSILVKIRHMVSSNPIQAHLMLLVYLFATKMLSVCRSFSKLKNESISGSKFEENFWIIITKICLLHQKINGNGAIIFWYFWKNNSLVFKQVVMNSVTIIVTSDSPQGLLEVLYLLGEGEKFPCPLSNWASNQNSSQNRVKSCSSQILEENVIVLSVLYSLSEAIQWRE